MLFSSFKDSFLEFSQALEAHPRHLTCPLVMGLDFEKLQTEQKLETVLIELGFKKEGESYWQREEEIYEAHFSDSRQGYLTLGELNAWRKRLLACCIDRKIWLSLPLAEDLIGSVGEATKIAIQSLLLSPRQPRVIFSPQTQPKEQAALFTALGFMRWPEAWLIIFDDYYARNNFSLEFLEAFLGLLEGNISVEDATEILSCLLKNYDINEYIDVTLSMYEIKDRLFYILREIYLK
ncbi:hypothetical protein [Cellvibrio japonicus]|uniref:hypothetical protein n=1 Tax=Cellvibrio japonicus TaxID=155077 RepID=UPI00059F169F|nr:hypothetical protein [Cellvibrio japonicus]QEI13340.1 hypothetical protein FY117_14645 [Cellvibrio japonicus]QEI16914.1 hypothetical protein FY116_14650 [Cellvibrio japonicus]QEI20492.1 hypothetical protein FY115_14645 [Cellvibrio japonicus]